MVKQISNNIPSTFSIKPRCIPNNIQLADPLFTEPQRIDMLATAILKSSRIAQCFKKNSLVG